MRNVIVILAAGLALSACVSDDGDTAPVRTSNVKISDAWASLPPPGAKDAAGFFTASSTNGDELQSATCTCAARVELHEMVADKKMMTMRPVTRGVPVLAGESVTLKPSGLHLMFVGLTGPLKEGDVVHVKLTFQTAGVVEADLPVRAWSEGR